MIKKFEHYKGHIRRLLLVFVIFSIGFTFGKHSINTKNTNAAPSKTTSQASATDGESLVKLYYMHAMFRCVTCNKIEEQAQKLTKSEFSDQLSSRKIEWVEVNFQENHALATKFDVVSSCVVVAVVKNGHIESFERLDKVWTLLDKQDEFNAYIRTAIQKALEQI